MLPTATACFLAMEISIRQWDVCVCLVSPGTTCLGFARELAGCKVSGKHPTLILNPVNALVLMSGEHMGEALAN